MNIILLGGIVLKHQNDIISRQLFAVIKMIRVNVQKFERIKFRLGNIEHMLDQRRVGRVMFHIHILVELFLIEIAR